MSQPQARPRQRIKETKGKQEAVDIPIHLIVRRPIRGVVGIQGIDETLCQRYLDEHTTNTTNLEAQVSCRSCLKLLSGNRKKRESVEDSKQAPLAVGPKIRRRAKKETDGQGTLF
jgi:hypothetical protein